MAPDDDVRRAVRLESADGAEPGFKTPVIAFDAVVLLLPGVMQRGRYQFLDHVREGRCPVGDDLARVAVKTQGNREEPARTGDVATRGHVQVNHLCVLVDCPLHLIWSDLLSIGRVRRPSRLFEAGASCFVVVGLASVSLATRGQTDIRGLDTAGRCFRQERDRVSSVERREPLR